MNNIIPLPQIISQLSQLTDCDVATARKFLHEFFATIESSLAAGESITIKNIGTFSRSDNSAEPIVFVPDKELADAINTPFAMFEAIAIDDDFDEATLSEIVAETPAESPQEKQNIPLEPIDDKGEIEEHLADNVVEPVEHNTEDAAVEENSESEQVVEPNETDSIEGQADVTPAMEHEVVADVAEIDQPYEDVQDEEQNNAGNGMKIIVPILTFVIGLIIGNLCPKVFDGNSDTMEKTMQADSIEQVLPVAQIQDSVVVSDSVKNELADTIKEENDHKTEAVKTSVPEPQYDTITNKRFLTTMAKQYYGRKDYWVYIYRANLDIIGDPNRIKSGTRVRIPRKEEFATGLSEEENIAKAHSLAAEIYAKYK